MGQQSSNRTIAKNTVAMYIRMVVTMVVSLFTSRVVLQILGIEDMGINATVGGVVAFSGFINSALTTGTSRFLTVALGKGDLQTMKDTFSTCFWTHLLLGLLLGVIIEIVGLWFIYNKLIIPANRMDAAIWVFHLSVISMIAGMTQIPYGCCMIAHERMTMFAYTSLVNAVAKLLIVYALTLFEFDKLKLYSTLFFITSMGMLVFYRWYCSTRFEECKLQFKLSKEILIPVTNFSGWSLFSGLSITLCSNGILILLNMFFSPAVVAARSISLNVNYYATEFMNNFRQAANPQIIKRHASGDLNGSQHLLLETTKLCYYMMLILSLPIFLLSYELLYLWLGQVPEYTDIFLKLVIVQSLFQMFDIGLYTAVFANGNLKWNALTAPFIGFLCLPIVYILFKIGYSPIALSWVFLIQNIILGCIQKPVILVKICGYRYCDLIKMFAMCFKVTFFSILIPFIFNYVIRTLTDSTIIIFLSVGFVSAVCTCVSVWIFGLNRAMRNKVLNFLRRKMHL